MKFGSPSSGCESRAAKGEPAQPVASLATKAATPSAMRRCASMRAVGNAATKIIIIPGVEGVALLEDDGGLTRHRARAGRTRRGLRPRHAARGRSRNLGGPHFSLRLALWMRARPADATRGGSAQNKHPRQGRPLARGDRSHGRRGWGSRRAAYERRRRGTGQHPDPKEQRRPVLREGMCRPWSAATSACERMRR